MSLLPESFSDFTSLKCDREAFIVDYLESRGVPASIISLGTSRHIYARFPSGAYNPAFKIKTAIAHYDRFPGSPGANDNSAAVWQLMDWAVRLKDSPGVHNVRVIFTSGEELGSSASVRDLGAFELAERLKALGVTRDDVFVFDCCGRGDVFVLSKPVDAVGIPVGFRKRLRDLYARTSDLLREKAPGSWICLPVSASDNAGFIAQGIPAALITVLPAEEATQYVRLLQLEKGLEEQVVNNAVPDSPVKEKLPETWRILHSMQDSAASLTPKTFALMAGLLDGIAGRNWVA